jgi:hypothetical protein
MNVETYLRDRVQDQIAYYSSKSRVNKNRYQRLQIVAIVFGVLVPVLIGFSEQQPFLKYIAGALGAVVAIIESAQSLYKYKDNWITYRSTSEALIRERFLFNSNAGMYRDAEAFTRFVEQVEQILSAENRVWLTHTAKN